MAENQTQVYDPWNDSATNARKAAAQQQLQQLQASRAQLLQARTQALMQAQQNTNMLLQPNWQQSVTQPYDAQISQIDSQISQTNNQMSGTNADGTPIAPEWRSLVDPETGQLRSQYQLKIDALDPTKWEGYSKFKGEALRDAGTQSEWAKIASAKQMQEEAMARDAAARQAMTGQAQALSQLQMRGGMASGARGRAAMMGARDLMMARQGVGREGIMARLGISQQDETSRQDQLSKLMSSETDIGKANKELEARTGQYNLGNLLREIEGRKAWEQDQYKEKMKQWASEREAQATERSGGGGGSGGK